MDLLKTSKKHEPQTRSTHAVTLPIKTTISPPAPTTEMPPEKLTSLLEEYFELQDLDSTVKEFVDYVVSNLEYLTFDSFAFIRSFFFFLFF